MPTTTKKQAPLTFTVGIIAKRAFKELLKNDPLRMAGATAFFTIFALPPILIIIVQVMGLLFDPMSLRQELYDQLSITIGSESTIQIINTLQAVRNLAVNWPITVGGFLFLVFIATTLFKIIKSSINQLWKIKQVAKQNLWRLLRMRLKSVIVIVLAGLLFVVGLAAEGVQTYLGSVLHAFLPGLASYFNSVLGYVISVIIVTLWFSMVFRFLPDARPDWSISLVGAFFTSILFNAGKILLRWLLVKSNLNTLYGASGSVVLLLLFVFYCSLILYFGASFTKALGEWKGTPIRPLPGAMHYRLAETEV